VIVIEATKYAAKIRALERFARQVARRLRLSADVSVLITGSAEVRKLNRRFRRKDKATDVLSFPRQNGAGEPAGDVAISAEIAAENALRYGHSPADELKILILHGMLHLAGYDHERDNGEMASRENALRKELHLPASLIGRNTARKEQKRKARVTT
jgi:probable rRNA maturation factor